MTNAELINALVASGRAKHARTLLRLEKIEARLGTPSQRPGDEALAVKLAHSLISVACAAAYPNKPFSVRRLDA